MISLVYYEGSIQYNIESMVQKVVWSGDIKQASRKLDVTIANINPAGTAPIMSFSEGNQIRFYVNGTEQFRGIIFEIKEPHDGMQSLTVYDEAKYLLMNSDSRLFKNVKASGVFSQLCKEFGIPVGTVTDTGYYIKKFSMRDASLWDTFQRALAATKAETGKKFWLYSSMGKMNLVERGVSPIRWVLSDKENIVSSSKSTSIEDLRNSIKVISGDIESKDKAPVIRSARDQASINKYGLMQAVVSDSDLTPSRAQTRANKELKERNKPQIDIDISSIGIIEVIAGRGVYAYDGMSGLSGGYYVLSDTHTWDDNGTHMMDVTLSATDELPIPDLSDSELDELKGIVKK